jgi:aminopeptidase N
MRSQRRLVLIVFALVSAACTAAPVQPIGTAAAPTAAPVAPAAAITMPPGDRAVYQAAMKPEFAAEIDQFGSAPQYQIDLNIASDLRSYSATQKVRYTNAETESLQEIYFISFANLSSYGGKLKMDAVKLNGQPMKPQFKPDNVLTKIDLPEPLPPGESIELELAYTAQVPVLDIAAGYNQFGLHDEVLTLPNFYPQIPVYDDEGWNVTLGPGYGDAVFSDTALYQVNITAPADQQVVTSGVCNLAKAEATKDHTPSPGFQTWQCVSGPMRDFVIAMSSAYEVTSTAASGIKLNSYYLPDDAEAGRRGLQVMADAVQSFTRRFGPYPFNELDLLATPTTAGGIEYPGVIVVAADLYGEGSTYQESTTAHEAAHQWWYSLVGNDQVDEPWLDEALTQFSTGLYYRDVYGLAGLTGFVDHLKNRYQRVQGTPDDLRADLPVAEYSVPQYSSLVYGKAPLFFNALYEELGDAKFNQLLQEYFQRYRYEVAYPQDFLTLAEQYAGKGPLAKMMEKWLTTP